MNRQIKTLSWKWDKPSCTLWAHVTFRDGESVGVGLPLAHVVATFDAVAREFGIEFGPYVGDCESVDGLFSSIKRLARKVVPKPLKKTFDKATRILEQTAKVAATVVKSKYTTYALAGLAVICPAVGGPALAAQSAARAALLIADAANAAAKTGVKTAQTALQIAKGRNVVRSVRRILPTNNRNRMAIAALQSIGGR
jgi:hypothetical protein